MTKKLVILLLVLTFLKGVLWAIFTPIFQTPDEQLQYLYIQYLAEHKRPPEQQEVLLFPEESLDACRLLEFGKMAYNIILYNKIIF